MSQNELYTALAKAQAAIKGAVKDSTNPHFKSRYADLESVIEAVRKPFADNGLSFSQSVDVPDRLVTTIFHSSGEAVISSVPLIIAKQDMQGVGSAITYARRYGLAAAAGVSQTDDDGTAACDNTPAKQFAAAVQHAKAEREPHWETERKRKDEQAEMFREGPDVFEKLPFNWERDKHLLNAAIRDLNISSSTAKQHRMDLGVVLSREAKNNYEEILKVTKAFFELKGGLDVEA